MTYTDVWNDSEFRKAAAPFHRQLMQLSPLAQHPAHEQHAEYVALRRQIRRVYQNHWARLRRAQHEERQAGASHG